MTNNQSNEPENREHDFKPNGFGSDHCLICGGKVSEHTVENREQTFESKLDVIVQRLSLEQQFLGEQYSKDQIGELEFQSKDDDVRDSATQAIKTLVLEDVVGEDGAEDGTIGSDTQ